MANDEAVRVLRDWFDRNELEPPDEELHKILSVLSRLEQSRVARAVEELDSVVTSTGAVWAPMLLRLRAILVGTDVHDGGGLPRRPVDGSHKLGKRYNGRCEACRAVMGSAEWDKPCPGAGEPAELSSGQHIACRICGAPPKMDGLCTSARCRRQAAGIPVVDPPYPGRAPDRGSIALPPGLNTELMTPAGRAEYEIQWPPAAAKPSRLFTLLLSEETAAESKDEPHLPVLVRAPCRYLDGSRQS